MAGEQPRNTGEQGTNPDQPSNQGGSLGEEGGTPSQPPQVEGDAGAVDYESGLTAAELMEREWLQLCSRLRELQTQLKKSLIEIINEYLQSLDREIAPEEYSKVVQDLERLNPVVLESRGTEELETMIQIVSEYIQRSRINNPNSKLLAGFVVQIADELKEAIVDKIEFRQQFSYETKADFLKRLISLVVRLILKVGPNDSEFRGGTLIKKYIFPPGHALLEVLEKAACASLNEAEKLNDRQKLIGTIFSLLKMTQKLRADEIWPIYNKILSITYEEAKKLNNPQELIDTISNLLEVTEKLQTDEIRLIEKILEITYIIIGNNQVIDNNLKEELKSRLIGINYQNIIAEAIKQLHEILRQSVDQYQ